MTSKKTTFKGFTFKKTGQQPGDTSKASKFGPLPGCSGSSNTLPTALTEQASNPTASESNLVEFGGIKKDPLKNGLQTSMLSFARKKQVAVAAVLPQRSSGGSHSIQENKVPSLKIKESPLSNELPIEVFEDDDDFETAVFSQVLPLTVPSKKQKSPALDGSNMILQNKKKNTFPVTSNKRNEIDSDEDITNKPKRRRTINVIESDGEDDANFDQQIESTNNANSGRTSSNTTTISQTSLVYNTVKQENDICKHPLLSSLSRSSIGDVAAMRDILLQVTDEVCDIICNISTGDLMDLVASNYERLQKLLSVRKQIKDLKVVDVTKPLGPVNHSTPILRASRTDGQQPSGNIDFQSCSPLSGGKGNNQDTGVGKKNSFSMAAVTDKNASPFPSLNSFYDAETPKSHVLQPGQIVNKTSFKTDYNEGNTYSFNSVFSRQNSFDDLFETEKPAVGDRTEKESCPSINKRNTLNIKDNDYDYLGLDMSNQSSRQIDDIDFEDEMEVAMMFDEEGKNHRTEKESCPSINKRNTLNIKDNDYDYLGLDMSNQSSRQIDDIDFEDEMEVAMMFDEEGKNHDFGDRKEELIKEEKRKSFNIEVSPTYTEPTYECSIIEESSAYPEDINSNALDADYTAVFGVGDRDDGASPEFTGMNFEHSGTLQNMFTQVFGLKEFRHNQLPAINAALLGEDCFILMPTGGGKSLCYQLPALVTNGVSIIISPLRALIQDQTQRLLSLDIPASHLSSDVDNQQAQSIYSGMYQRTPAYKMLYVTPEKLSASEKLLNCLDSLYKRQLLTRFVIDEAHCVSHWGHDFRPDYKKLYILRQRYPGVPMMALTATATPRVRKDIIHQLGMTSPKWFMQSFNRPNLKYTVQNKKPSSTTKDIIEMIKTKFQNDSGIVYCLSRKECDSVATEFQQAGIQAESYHAGLDDSSRARVQERWLSDDNCKVICATIAFGMGIDKSDVRFVIHYSLPKSVEGYYQEAGRAGRDGVLSYCILFYSYQDVKRLRRMLDMDPTATYESKRVHIDNLFRMISYCENVTDCRRCQILQYFGECSFDRSMCAYMPGAICDNCQIKNTFSLRDVTTDAMEVVKCVKQINSSSRNNYTLIHLVDIFKGSNTSKIQTLGHSKLALHGRGKNWTRADVERLCRKLVIERILKEDLVVNAQDHTMCYVKLGPRAMDLMQHKIKVELAIQGGRRRADVAKVGTEPKNTREKVEAACLAELRALAKKIAAENNMKNYALIFPESALKQLAQCTPITKEEMIEQIDHFNSTIVEKYQAHRFLEITVKYSMELTALDEEDDEDELESSASGEWASRYFEETSTPGSARGRGRGFQRGGKRKFFNKGKGKSKKAMPSGNFAASGRKKKTATNLNSLAQYQHKNQKTSKAGGVNYKNNQNLSTASASEHRPTAVSKSTLGFMPDPRSRSFLTPSFAKSRGGFM